MLPKEGTLCTINDTVYRVQKIRNQPATKTEFPKTELELEPINFGVPKFHFPSPAEATALLCVMAGMARSGSVFELKLSYELLQRAFRNTTELLKAQVSVEEPNRKVNDAE